MVAIVDVSARKPVPDLVKQMERLTEQARNGELIGIMWVASWHGDLVTHGWSVTERSQQRRMVGEMMMCLVDRANEINAQS